jgi:hypothetical protein
MKIKKIKGTYNDYSVEMSFGQLLAVKNALGADHADPVADELYAELEWYLTNIPGPGEDEEDLKKAEEAGESGMASPEAAETPGGPAGPAQGDTNDLLPAPPGSEGEGVGEGGELPPPEGIEDEGAAAAAGGPPGPSEEGGEESEADRRLPPPPEE